METKQKPFKIFWQEPRTELFKHEGKLLTGDQKEKLMQLLEPNYDFITVTFVATPPPNNN